MPGKRKYRSKLTLHPLEGRQGPLLLSPFPTFATFSEQLNEKITTPPQGFSIVLEFDDSEPWLLGQTKLCEFTFLHWDNRPEAENETTIVIYEGKPIANGNVIAEEI